MLTADLVRARRRGDELRIVPLDDGLRGHALDLASDLLALAHSHVGRTREELEEAWEAVRSSSRDQRLADGLCKLVEDGCDIEADPSLDPVELRRAVFERSSEAWKALDPAATFDRAAVLREVAADLGTSEDVLERGLYADLRNAHLLRAAPAMRAEHLVEAYELAQAQAVLLRAVRVTVELAEATPGACRELFRKLKFLRLLYTIHARDKGGYRIEIDGPYSLFEAGTKYGLALALALPAIRAAGHFKLEADVRWGAERRPLRFLLRGEASEATAEARLPDDVATLLASLAELDTPWRAEPTTTILDLPGVGLCVPDLAFTHGETGEVVYLEVLGYWSRDAVWKRVELVQAGLGEPIVFAVGKHLRVSEAALDDELPGALYVYKRTMLARQVVERVDAVARRPRT